MTTTTIPQVGATVTGRPLGQKRQQTIVVTYADADVTVGLLVSRKYPGNYRGQAVLDTATVTAEVTA